MSGIMEQSGDRDLPEEIIMDEILVRLTVKSLCQFKSVSKHWCTVISSSRFAKSHLKKNSNSNTARVFFQYDGDSQLLDYEAYDDTEDHNDAKWLSSFGKIVKDDQINGLAEAEVFGSSCGLICLLAQQGHFCLCNPILQESRKIDAPEPFDAKDVIVRGFGYVSSIDDFKLILGLRGQGDHPKMYVFSLKNNGWKEVQLEGDHFGVVANSKVDSCNGRLVNERLHWWIMPVGNNNNGRIFAFDMLHEAFNEIPIPQLLSFKISYMFNTLASSGLSTMEGCLSLSIIWEDHNVEIWMLKEYGDPYSWIRLYDLRFMSSYRYHCANFFGCTKTGKFLISCWNKSHYSFFFLVDPNQKYYPKFNHIKNFWGGTSTIVNFVESLVSPIGLAAPNP